MAPVRLVTEQPLTLNAATASIDPESPATLDRPDLLRPAPGGFLSADWLRHIRRDTIQARIRAQPGRAGRIKN